MSDRDLGPFASDKCFSLVTFPSLTTHVFFTEVTKHGVEHFIPTTGLPVFAWGGAQLQPGYAACQGCAQDGGDHPIGVCSADISAADGWCCVTSPSSLSIWMTFWWPAHQQVSTWHIFGKFWVTVGSRPDRKPAHDWFLRWVQFRSLLRCCWGGISMSGLIKPLQEFLGMVSVVGAGLSRAPGAGFNNDLFWFWRHDAHPSPSLHWPSLDGRCKEICAWYGCQTERVTLDRVKLVLLLAVEEVWPAQVPIRPGLPSDDLCSDCSLLWTWCLLPVFWMSAAAVTAG